MNEAASPKTEQIRPTLTKEKKAEQIIISPWLFDLARQLFPEEKNLINQIQQRLGGEQAAPYIRNIALVHEASQATLERAYIQFAGFGGSAISQTDFLGAMCEDTASNSDLLGIVVESVVNPEATGPIAPSIVERSLVNVELVLKQIRETPQLKQIHLSFRSMSALEAAHTSLLLDHIFKQKTEIITPALKQGAENRTLEIGSIFFFQAAGIMEQTLGEFLEGAKKIPSKENEISQIFPSLADFHRVMGLLEKAKSQHDAGSELRYQLLLQQMDKLNPYFRLIILKNNLKSQKDRLKAAVFAGKNADIQQRILAEISQTKKEIARQEENIDALAIFGDQSRDDAIKRQLLEIETEMYHLYPASTSDSQKLIQALEEKRRALLRPVIDEFLSPEDPPQVNVQRTEADKRNGVLRLLTALPILSVVKRMPELLRQRLIDADIPLFYIFSDRDGPFPAEKAFRSISNSLGGKAEFVLLFGNHPHSTTRPLNKAVAGVFTELMQRVAQLKAGTALQNPERKITFNVF